MALSSIIKMQLTHLKKPLLIYTIVCFILGLSFFISSNPLLDFGEDLLYVFESISLITCFIMGIIIYGSYAKAYAFLQNNKEKYILVALIWNIGFSLYLLILFVFLRNQYYLLDVESTDLNLVIIAFLTNCFFFNLGSIFGLFFKSNKRRKSLLKIILIILFPICGYYFIDAFFSISYYTAVNGLADAAGQFLIIMLPLNIALFSLCSLYYYRLSLIKAYSNE